MRYGIGLDIGITSIGFAVMELDEGDVPCRIAKIGSRIFEAAEIQDRQKKASSALPRREARSARRRTRRRKHRKERIKQLLINQNIITKTQLETLYDGKELSDIYELRAVALDRLLKNTELARVLIHLSQRRGFKSNRKNEVEPKDSKGLLKSIEANKEELTKYRTVGEMLYNRKKDKENKAEKIRNAPNDYSNTVQRDDVISEAHKIFECQRSFGHKICTKEFENKYCEILSSQRFFDEGPAEGSPYRVSPEDKVGICTFENKRLGGESNEKRAAKAMYSFERFDLLQRVNHIRLETGEKSRALYDEERSIIVDKAHISENLNYNQIRKALNLSESEEVRFNTVKYTRDKDYKACETKVKFSVLKTYHQIRKALNEVNENRIESIKTETLNEIGRIFTYNNNDDKIKEALAKTDLTPYDIEALVDKVKKFSKNGHLSLKALNNIMPHLEQGLTYDKACKEAGYNFKARGDVEAKPLIHLDKLAEATQNTITSPVARRALSQCAKVINAIIREMGTSPVYINIELSREVAKTRDERDKLDKVTKDNNANNERAKEQIKEYVKLEPRGLDIIKFRLWEDQRNECPYSGTRLVLNQIFDDPGYVEIDHIIPYSISYDDSYKNKILVKTAENRQKGNRLPLQYLSGKKRDDFEIWVKNSHLSDVKKKLLLKEELTDEDLKGFIERNLTDTKTITTFMFNYLSDYLLFNEFSNERKRHVTPVNGAVTSMLRKRWGLNKIREDGDLHHAMDAAVVACVTQNMINKLRWYYENNEKLWLNINKKTGEVKEKFPQPYDYGNRRNFSNELEIRLSTEPRKTLRDLNYPTYSYHTLENVEPVFISRMPSRKVSGAAHKETIKGIGENNSQIKKVALSSLKLNKDGEIDGYYNPNDDRLLYDELKNQLLNGGIKEPFYKPKSDGTPGPLVKKVKIAEKSTLNVLVHDKTGSADNGSMIRVDVFRVKGEGYYLVPIYVADVLKDELPNKAIIQGKAYDDWKDMKDDDFKFSLYTNDLVYIEREKPIELKKVNKKSKLPPTLTKEKGYFYYKGAHGGDRPQIDIIIHDNSYKFEDIAIKNLYVFEKRQIDVLGKISKVAYEQRKDFSEIKRR